MAANKRAIGKTGVSGGEEVYYNHGGDSGQGQLMPRNGCNERGARSPLGNDPCTGVTRPHGPIKSDIGRVGNMFAAVETPPPPPLVG